MTETHNLAVITGQGIGPSIVNASLSVLEALGSAYGVSFDIVPGPDLLASGVSFSNVASFYDSCSASGVPILHGPAGGRFVYDLRKWCDLYVKLTPVVPNALLADASLLKPALVEGVDILIVRDNVGGLYQGEYGFTGSGAAFQTSIYEMTGVQRLLAVASDLAMSRRGSLTVVLKPGGVPAISELWREAASVVSPLVSVSFLEIDNACYQLGASPSKFDVIVSPNMFGDVLGDTASIALGSRGLSYSANFNDSGFAVYQTAHGAAHDLAGKDAANPLAQFYTLGWLLEKSLRLGELRAALVSAIDRVLASGVRTFDIASSSSRVVGTQEMTSLVVAEVLRG